MKKHIIIAIIAFILGAACGIVGTVLVERQDVQKEVTMETATDTNATETDATITDATETDATITDATETDVTEEVTTEEVTEEPEVEKEEKEDILIAASAPVSTPTPPTPAIEATTEAPVAPEPQPEQSNYEPQSGDHLTKSGGVYYGPSGKETYYNLNMSGVVSIAQSQGIEGEYWVREDGCKMYGDYVICAADLNVHPRGSLVESSLGTCIVLDTGGFATNGSGVALDIAVDW